MQITIPQELEEGYIKSVEKGKQELLDSIIDLKRRNSPAYLIQKAEIEKATPESNIISFVRNSVMQIELDALHERKQTEMAMEEKTIRDKFTKEPKI